MTPLLRPFVTGRFPLFCFSVYRKKQTLQEQVISAPVYFTVMPWFVGLLVMVIDAGRDKEQRDCGVFHLATMHQLSHTQMQHKVKRTGSLQPLCDYRAKRTGC